MDATFNEQWGVVRAVTHHQKKEKEKKTNTLSISHKTSLNPSGMCALKRNSRWCNKKNSFGTIDSNWFSLRAWSLNFRDFSCHLFIKHFSARSIIFLCFHAGLDWFDPFAMLSMLVPSEFTGLVMSTFTADTESVCFPEVYWMGWVKRKNQWTRVHVR